MEILDIINEKDEVIGTATREECHNNPNIMHRVVHFTLYDKDLGKILLTKRSLKKRPDPGKIIFLGEHVLSGETYEDALLRGVKEELGFLPKYFKELGIKIFKQEEQKEYAKFFIIFFDGEEIMADRCEIESEWWLDIKELKNFNDNLSSITQYWIDSIDWNKAL